VTYRVYLALVSAAALACHSRSGGSAGAGGTAPAPCGNGIQDPGETGVDCGGSCSRQCLAGGVVVLPGNLVRISDTSWPYLMQSMRVRWKNAGGDFRDATGALQGPQPWATATLQDSDSEQVLAFDVTELVHRHLAEGDSHLENRGWILKHVSGIAAGKVHSSEGEAGKSPRLMVTTGEGERTLPVVTDIEFSSSSTVPAPATPLLGIGGGRLIGLWFDLSAIAEPVTSARLELITTDAQTGGGSMVEGLFPVDLTETFAPIPVRAGIAADHPGDVGLEEDPNVYLVERFEDRFMYRNGWFGVLGPDSSFVGESDPDDPSYQPPAPGVKAMKWTIRKGEFGPTNGYTPRWTFYSNLGEEPEEVYVRMYARLGKDFEGWAGKFPIGISGTYERLGNLNLTEFGTFSENPLTGLPWLKPDPPEYAGNGGVTSNGRNGWSARSDYVGSACYTNEATCLQPTTDPLTRGGYREVMYYTYHADQPDAKGEPFYFAEGLLGIVPKERWFVIEEYVKLNSVNADGSGNQDGILRAWVNGMLALEKTDFRVRDWPGNPAGANNIKIFAIWLAYIHGGTSPAPLPVTLYVANLVAAKSYIGPGTFALDYAAPSQDDGMCGSAGGQWRSAPPSAAEELCGQGRASAVATDAINGIWRWSCQGRNGATVACSAGTPVDPHAVVNGACGPAHGTTRSAPPEVYAELCQLGNPPPIVSGTGPWTWICSGKYGGSNASCAADRAGGNASPLDARCGPAHGMPRVSAPSAPRDLCLVGTATAVDGAGPFTWSCTGVNGGAAASCATLPGRVVP